MSFRRAGVSLSALALPPLRPPLLPAAARADFGGAGVSKGDPSRRSPIARSTTSRATCMKSSFDLFAMALSCHDSGAHATAPDFKLSHYQQFVSFDFRSCFAYCFLMLSIAWVVTCTGCKCVITCFAVDPQLEHGRGDNPPPQGSAVVMCPCCGSSYRYAGANIARGTPRTNPLCQRKVQRQPMDGALLVAASIVAAIRLRGEDIAPRGPKLVAVVHDSILLARTVLAEIDREK
jgi:hypothetical protein